MSRYNLPISGKFIGVRTSGFGAFCRCEKSKCNLPTDWKLLLMVPCLILVRFSHVTWVKILAEHVLVVTSKR